MVDLERTAAQLAHCIDPENARKCDTCTLRSAANCQEILMARALDLIRSQAEKEKPRRISLAEALKKPIVWIEDRSGVRAVRLRKINECAIGVARFNGNFFVDIDETKKWAIWDKDPEESEKQ